MAEHLSFLLRAPPTILQLLLLSTSPTPREVGRMVGTGRSGMGVDFSGGAASRVEGWSAFSTSSWAQREEFFLSVVAVVWGLAAKVLRVGTRADQ